jgi:hypothetical protein
LSLAQTATTGQISGVIVDPSGAVIPGAQLILTGDAGLRREAFSDTSGNYLFNLLPPGKYRLEVNAPGFKAVTLEGVTVKITESARVDVGLEVAAAGEKVTVTAQEPLLQTSAPTTGRVVEERTVAQLPLATRNFTQILGLSPGTATYLPDNTAVGRNSQNISVNGGRVTNNNFQINGVDANSMGTNSAPSLSIPAPETIQEFKVQTSLYDASFGRSGGGNIQAVTKSGGNDVHGAVYEYFRNDKLNANNPFLKADGVARPALKRNIFGGTLGGPIRRDKVSFFTSYQGTRERNGASLINSVSSRILITPGPNLTDDRSEQTLLRTFPVPAINPTALALLNARIPGGRFLTPTPQANGRYSGSTPSSYREDQFNANVDYRINDKNTLAVKFFFYNAPQTLVLPSFLGGGPNVPGFGNDQKNNGRLLSLQDVHIFSPTILNEVRLGYNFIRVDAFPQEPVTDASVGIMRANANTFPGLPLIRIAPAAGGVVIGTSPTIDVRATAPSTTLADVLSITRGRHTVRTGAEIRYNENNYVLNFFTRGQIDFLSFNDFLTGNTFVSVFGNGIGNRSLRATDYNFFAQDDWKVSKKLTLNLGLRYELDLPAYDTRGRIATFDPALYRPRPLAVGVNPIGPPIGGYVQAGNVISQLNLADALKANKRVVNSKDPHNFAPRIGFAYSPLDSNRLVVRGGYGIFYSRTSFQYITLSVLVPPTYVFGVNVGAPVANPFFPVPSQSQFPALVPGVALSGTVFDRNLHTPYIQQFNTSVQYELARDMLLEVGYVGTRGLNLFRQVGINQARLAGPQSPIVNDVTGEVITTNMPTNAARRAPLQGVSVNGFFQNQSTAQASYNSLQASLTKRFARGLQFLASYTYAKSIDNASGQGGGAGFGGVVNPGAVGETTTILGNQLNNRANRGISDFDRTHRFVLSGLWELPRPSFTDSSTAGRWLLANWQVGYIITAMSGLPIDIVDTGAGSLYGLSGGSAPLARPNWAPGASRQTATSGVPNGFFLNPAAFARPVVGAGQPIPSSGGRAIADALGTDFGDVGRNVLRGPRQTNVDFSIVKRFPVRETKNFEFRVEFFNLFNNVNLANPVSDVNASLSLVGTTDPATGRVLTAADIIDPTTGRILRPGTFGKVISASNNPRLIQFAFKFNF